MNLPPDAHFLDIDDCTLFNLEPAFLVALNILFINFFIVGLLATLAAIAGPNVNGLIIQFSGNNYNSIMLVAALFMVFALILMWGVRRGLFSKNIGRRGASCDKACTMGR